MYRNKITNTRISRESWEKEDKETSSEVSWSVEKRPFGEVEAPPNNLAPIRVMSLFFTGRKFICK